MTLPTEMQTRRARDPRDARVLLTGMPKSGKTTLLSGWPPKSTLILDTHGGTLDLPGGHFVEHVTDWPSFVAAVDLIVKGGHAFRTIGLDLVDDLWHFADRHFAGKGKPLATATDDYGRSAKTAEGEFRRQVGRLFASPHGLWFVSHTDTEDHDGVTRFVPRLDKKVRTYVEGACSYILLLETLGARRVLHTAPSAKFQAGARTPLPEPMPPDAQQLYYAMRDGLRADVGEAPASDADAPAADDDVEPAEAPEAAAVGA